MHRHHGRRGYGYGRRRHRPYYGGGWGGYPYAMPYYGFRPFLPYYNPVLW